MNRVFSTLAFAALAFAAGSAIAQPSITSLGGGVPLGVTNNLSGSYYIGGSGLSTTAATRWTLTGSTLTATELGGTLGGGYISKDDGAYLTTLVLNASPRWASGNTATGVLPPFTPSPAGLTVSTTLPPATAPGGARWSFGSSSNTVMGALPIIPFTPNPIPVSTMQIASVACSAGVATATTTLTHGLTAGDVVVITGNTVAAYNGQFTVSSAPTTTTFRYAATCGAAGTGGQGTKQAAAIGPWVVTTVSCSGGTATATTSAPHGLAVNDIAIITGNTVFAYNGVYKVSAVTSATTFEYTGVTCGAAGTGGTVVKQVVDIGTSGVYGPSSANGVAPDSSSFLTPNAISSNGRFIVGLAYACVYNAGGTFGTATGPGTNISANSFYWRPALWDAQGNAGAGSLVVLPTPFKTSSLTRRRTGNPYAVSNDGLVIAGATEHNAGVTPNADADGGRFCVWRWNSGTSSFDLTYLDTGVDANGFPKGISSTPGSLAMNAAGTIIVARGPDGITKWTWNGSTWGAPTIIGSNLSAPASWLPFAVTSCGAPPNIAGTLAMSDDGNTIVGSAVYSTCGSFMSGGFIWTSGDNTIVDWYDYLRALNTPGVAPGGVYGPVGDLGDTSKGLPALGYPIAISPDSNAVTSFQGGTQRIPGAVPTIVLFTGGPACVAPSITNNPAATTLITACSSSIILNVSASGSGPFTYQWYKDGSPLSDGPLASGNNVTGSTSFQFRVTPPTGRTLAPSDAGTYYAVVTGQCGSPVQSTNAVVSIDPAFPVGSVTNDVCTGARTVTSGNNVLAAGETVCGAYVNDPLSTPSCAPTTVKTDRWYSFTPVSNGNYRIDTCGSSFDTVMSIYAGSCGTSELACNNDYNTGPSTGCSAQRSRISSIALTGGTPYLICIAAQGTAFISSTSLINLSINLAPPLPANDSCNTPATAVLGVNAYNTTEATQDGTVVSTCSSTSSASRDVWFLYTPTQPGRLTASTCPTGVAPGGYSLMTNTVLSFHNGPCGADLTCNDNHTPVPAGCGTSLSTISRYPIQASNSLWIRIAGNNSGTFGAGQLSLTFGCVADVDDGNSTGTPDGGVGIEDLLYYLGRYDLGVAAADVDNGSGTGVPDGGVGIEDLLFYLDRYDVGC